MHTAERVLESFNVKQRGRPDGMPVVLAHGLGCTQNMWRPVATLLERDFRLITFDLVGHGGADRRAWDPTRHASLDGHAEDLLSIITALGLRQVAFVGHSVAAMIGVLAALREPSRFSSLCLVAPSPRYINGPGYVGGFEPEQIDALLQAIDANWEAWAQEMAPVIIANPERPELATQLTSSFCLTDAEIVKQLARVTFLSDCRDEIARVAHPSLILQCSEDAIAPVEVGAFMQDAMPRGEMVLLKATGHCPHVSAPAETTRAIREFLDRQVVHPAEPVAA